MDIALTGSSSFATDGRRKATHALSLALLAGAATQALFWHTGMGLNFWLWDLLVVGATIAAHRHDAIRPTGWGAIAACILLGFSIVRFESTWTLLIAVPSTLAILAALPLLVGEGSTLAGLSRIPGRIATVLGRAPQAILELLRLPGVAIGGAAGGLLRGLLVGLPTAGLFTLLLSSDAEFATWIGRARDQVGEAILFAAWSVLSAASYLVAHAIHRPVAVSPGGRAPHGPYRVRMDGVITLPLQTAARVSVLTWAMVVGQVTLVFGVFVAANLRHLFGGHALVRAAGSVTYSRYLHSGFSELLAATALSVCLVLTGHALLQPRGGDSRDAAVPGGWLLASLEGTLLALTGVTVASCWQRLHIYEDAYGASHLRLGVAFVEAGVLGVVLLTLGKVVARRWTGHAGAVVALGVGLAVAATGFNADAYVARTNLDRAGGGRPLDVEYLASLSGDARGVLAHPYVRSNAELSARLESAFSVRRGRDLRSFRGLWR